MFTFLVCLVHLSFTTLTKSRVWMLANILRQPTLNGTRLDDMFHRLWAIGHKRLDFNCLGHNSYSNSNGNPDRNKNSIQLKIAQVVQHCWLSNAVTTRLSWLNNVVQRTMLFNEQCCSTNNVVQRTMLFTVVSTILIEQVVRYCYHCCSTLLTSCNSIDGWTML